jgi:preprotein translocase SecE subunit
LQCRDDKISSIYYVLSYYDSLETLQKVTFPTKKDYINLTLAIFATVIISGAFFILVDTFLAGAYRAFYTTMRPDGQEKLQQQALLSGSHSPSTGSEHVNPDLS